MQYILPAKLSTFCNILSSLPVFKVLQRLTQKTSSAAYAESSSQFYYLAYTHLGEICSIGVLDLPDFVDRRRGGLAERYLFTLVERKRISTSELFGSFRKTSETPNFELGYAFSEHFQTTANTSEVEIRFLSTRVSH